MEIVVLWMMVSAICAESMNNFDDLEERISKCASKSELQKLTNGVEKLANMVRHFVLVKLTSQWFVNLK